MSGERILVRGSELRVGMLGAMLARRWLCSGRKLVLSIEAGEGEATTLLARPGVHGFHGELGIPMDALVQQTRAQPVLAYEIETPGGKAQLPFSPFGMQRAGVDFHQYWQRANAMGDQPALTEFSLALALEGAGKPAGPEQLYRAKLEFGLRMDRARYANMLLQFAQSQGASIVQGGDADADLIVDCRMDAALPGWNHGTVSVATDNDICGLEWHVLAAAARRLVGLMVNLSSSAPEQREYTRLAEAEAERIADMRELLSLANPSKTARSALKRKLDVFAACGRIPTEDFEVFTPPEWLAALWVRGVKPRRSDRMADAMPEAELLKWLASLHQQIGTIAQRGLAA